MSEPAADSVRCDCLLGRCDSMRAEVYVRFVGPAGPGHGRLTGTLSGPECRWATTLPVTTTIRPVPGEPPVDAAETILGRAVLTEPAYWTPELPNRYRLVATAETDGRVIGTVRQTVGLRRLGVRGRSLWLDGRRFVPRGATAMGAEDEVEAFRQASLTAVVTDPGETFLDGCDVAGVAVVARCHETVSDAAAIAACRQRIVAWSRHPAVFVAVLPAALPTDQATLILADTRAARGTLLVAVEVDGTLPPGSLPSGCDAIVVALPAGGIPHPAWRNFEPVVPLIATRPDARDAARSRRSCDTLQADLATWGTAGGSPAHDWAGYLISRVPEPELSRP